MLFSGFGFEQNGVCFGFTELRLVGFAFGAKKCKFWDFLILK